MARHEGPALKGAQDLEGCAVGTQGVNLALGIVDHLARLTRVHLPREINA